MTTPNKILATLNASAFAAALLASTSIASAEDLNVKWKGAPEFSSADGNYKMKIRGRLFTDWATLSDNDGKIADTTEFRTARLGVEGVVMKDVKYKFEIDFAGNKATIKDAYVEWALKPISIAVGQYKVPVSLEEQTSSRYITFMERSSMTDAFGFSRNVGISAHFAKKDFTVKAGVFQGNSGGNAANEGRTYAVRATYAAKIENSLIHVGASAFKRNNDKGDVTNHYRQRPHLHLSPTRFVDTGSFDAKSDTFFGAELGAIMGPLSAQAEWGWMKSQAPAGGMDASFNGGYVDVTYILTGDKRGYKGGAFDRIKVANPVFEGGTGAWQLAVRYDVIDLTDTVAAVIGGKQTTYVAGVNWHLNNYSRVMMNYSNSDINGGAYDGQKIKAFGMRFQVDW